MLKMKGRSSYHKYNLSVEMFFFTRDKKDDNLFFFQKTLWIVLFIIMEM